MIWLTLIPKLVRPFSFLGLCHLAHAIVSLTFHRPTHGLCLPSQGSVVRHYFCFDGKARISFSDSRTVFWKTLCFVFDGKTHISCWDSRTMFWKTFCFLKPMSLTMKYQCLTMACAQSQRPNTKCLWNRGDFTCDTTYSCDMTYLYDMTHSCDMIHSYYMTHLYDMTHWCEMNQSYDMT